MTETAAPLKSARRGLPREGEGGFTQCWYPVLLAEQVPPGKVVGAEFLDGRVVVYRDRDGRPHVHSAYCRHLGADLANGDIQGDDIRCAFHHWQYAPDGRCSKIPASPDKVPSHARLFSYPVAEAWGLIWAFNGEEATYPLPSFPTHDPGDLQFLAVETEVFNVDPFVLLTNSMDFQHLVELHGMTLHVEPDDIVMEGSVFEFVAEGHIPNFGEMHQHVKVFGNNCITLTLTQGDEVEMLTMFAGVPVNGRTRGYTVAATCRSDGTEDDDQRVTQVLALGQALAAQLQAEDSPIMNTIRFREDVLIDADRGLAKFLRYVRKLPRAHPGDGLIN